MHVSENVPRIGLVLGAGGIAGYSFHAGAMAALHEATGWDPRTADIIVGTSAGSSVGAVLRGNVSVPELVSRILSVPTDAQGMDRLRRVAGRGQTRIDARALLPSSPRYLARELIGMPKLDHDVGTLLAAALPPGVLDTAVLGEQADVLHPDGWPERPLWVCAVNLDRGGLTVFGRDRTDTSVGDAVAASCAIPAWFRPVQVGAHRHVDGGMRSPTNADLLAEEDLDLVVVLSPMSASRFDRRSPLGSFLRFLPSRQLRREVGHLHRADIPTIVLEPDDDIGRVMGLNPMDPTKVVPVLAESAMAIAEHLEEVVDDDALDLLALAGRRLTSPADVPYPL